MSSATSRALDAIDPSLNAFVSLDPARALAREAVDAGGSLAGVVIAVKDLFDVAGMRTTYGSAIFAEHVPEATAPAVQLLENQGAIVLGKTNLHEFAFGVSGLNPVLGDMPCPADRERTAGGSSGGSAIAVATGVCRLALGSDTSGSARIPAACCGVYGLKLTHGSLPMTGVFPLSPSYDSVGLLAADVDVLMLALGLSELPDLRRLRVARLGEDVLLPPLPEAHWVRFRHESIEVHAQLFASFGELYGRDLQWKLRRELGDLAAADLEMAAWRAEVEIALSGFDVLLGPVFDGPAPLHADVVRDYEDDTYGESDRLLAYTPVANALGWPAIAIPTAGGPLHALARPRCEAHLLAVAAASGERE